jgi:hypothetical protein
VTGRHLKIRSGTLRMSPVEPKCPGPRLVKIVVGIARNDPRAVQHTQGVQLRRASRAPMTPRPVQHTRGSN